MIDKPYQKGTHGVCHVNGSTAECILMHDSPPDQEAVFVKLLEDLICMEQGETIEIQRYQFRPGKPLL